MEPSSLCNVVVQCYSVCSSWLRKYPLVYETTKLLYSNYRKFYKHLMFMFKAILRYGCYLKIFFTIELGF